MDQQKTKLQLEKIIAKLRGTIKEYENIPLACQDYYYLIKLNGYLEKAYAYSKLAYKQMKEE